MLFWLREFSLVFGNSVTKISLKFAVTILMTLMAFKIVTECEMTMLINRLSLTVDP